MDDRFFVAWVLRHELHEVIEEIAGIVRTRRSFGVILDAERRMIAMAKAFQRIVIQIHVRDFDFVQVERIGIHREAVIVRCDLHLAGDFVDHRMIGAAMAELQLVRFSAPSARPRI